MVLITDDDGTVLAKRYDAAGEEASLLLMWHADRRVSLLETVGSLSADGGVDPGGDGRSVATILGAVIERTDRAVACASAKLPRVPLAEAIAAIALPTSPDLPEGTRRRLTCDGPWPFYTTTALTSVRWRQDGSVELSRIETTDANLLSITLAGWINFLFTGRFH